MSLPSSAASTRRLQGHASDPQFANTLARGLRVLQCFSANTPQLGNGDISRMTGLPKPTVSRLTYTLIELGYLRRCSDSTQFEVGTGVLCLGYPVLSRLAFQHVAMPHLLRLAETIDGSATVFVRDRLRMVALENATHRDILKRRPHTGISIELVGSNAGLCWLVGASPREREQAMREIAHHQPEDLDNTKADYEMGAGQMRRHGYVMRRPSWRRDTSVLSAPLWRRPGDELLVLSCAMEAPQEHAAGLEQSVGRHLLEVTRAISAELSGKPAPMR